MERFNEYNQTNLIFLYYYTWTGAVYDSSETMYRMVRGYHAETIRIVSVFNGVHGSNNIGYRDKLSFNQGVIT